MPWQGSSVQTPVQYEEDIWVEEPYTPPVRSAVYSRSGFSRNNDSYEQQQNGTFGHRNFPDGSIGRGRSRGGRGRSEGVTDWRRSEPRENENNDLTIFPVPSKDVGRIIGKGGSKIRELEEASGARIRVMRDDEDGASDDPYEARVQLRGSSEAREKAKQIIEDFISPTSSAKDSQAKSSQPEPAPFVDWAKLLADSDRQREERWKALPPIIKNFYNEHDDVRNMSREEVARFRMENNNIVVTSLEEDDERPFSNPVQTFEQAFGDHPDILDEIYKNKFEKPSPIQSQAWPVLLQGHDLIGIAQTGTGKTLAFLLPAFIHIDRQPVPRAERTGPSCLVLAPTRELAQQIEREAKKYNYRGIKCVCVYGGGSRREQIQIINKGVEIVIATPGRLNDLVMNNIIDLNYVTYLILDEADRMLDMGFEPQIKKVLLDIRPDRQTVMTSATWPEGVRRLARQYMSNPFQVFIGSLDLAAVHTVSQRVLLIDDSEKRDKLLEFVQTMQPDDKVIVFLDKKAMVDHLASDFILAGIECQSIHGDREQCDREQALEDLRTGAVRILIATDVAARGLDIKDITHIYNYDFPRNIEEYVHRVGRTGRAGRSGESITLITRENWRQARELISILEEANQEVPEGLYSMAERYDAWKKRRDEERPMRGDRDRNGWGGGGGGFRRGGGGRSNNRW
ncbi:probable ATP-dependent RNA helicase DDX43 [Ornithodoros turicata]|uniref:RNA helicase n=1 Tax=Ornithodoros turicata TaxID=34597 RepID=A0A2R5LID1_9ACAR